MAMVSNPEHSQTLVDLALLVSPREGGEPVYAVNVVQESAEAPSALAEAERLLGKIVLRGVAGGDNLIPVARVSYNVAEGVAQTAAELRASAIVAGAGPGSQWMRRPYGQVIDQVVGSTRQLFMVLRSERPLGLHSQVVAVVPPLSERQPGFPRAAAAVKSLARGIKARLSLVSLEHDLPSVSAEWERVRPAIAFQKAGAATWKDVLTALKRYPPASTIFALLNVRQGSLAWQPAVDKLPMAFLEDVPDASLLCVYLPEEEGRPEPEQAITEEAGPAGLLDQARDEGRLLIWGRPMAIADAVRALITLEYPEDRQAQARLSAVFMDIAQREPVELKPGIVLLHAHVPEAAEPVLLWGLSAQGIPNLALKDKMRVLIVLLAPEGQPPEEHLKTLSRLAKEVMAEDFWKRLEAAGGGRPGS
jgi:mannitol/fructose-specific phosphotransferase system IIA component (Ntr-type)